ncbi:hypothetical protein Pcinc_039689 [Petrolisthes cinctipes]|uniref:Uncharacterized protein n=1 Tax=Petrolisthes cinctipes TaxID=88211 RepID=A0AAE1BNG7_PETCI|nr:hypothetical protein Pcinc_039689 [Petrolisthes cinctipes]
MRRDLRVIRDRGEKEGNKYEREEEVGVMERRKEETLAHCSLSALFPLGSLSATQVYSSDESNQVQFLCPPVTGNFGWLLPSPHLTSPRSTSPLLAPPPLTPSHLSSSHLTSPHPISPLLAPPPLTPSHLPSPHLTSPHPISPPLTPSHLPSPHLTSPHLSSPHLPPPPLPSPHLTSPRSTTALFIGLSGPPFS